MDNKLVENLGDPNKGKYTDRIFLHDTKNNVSREITFKEAKELTLNNFIISPDDATISGHYDSGGDSFFIFGSHSSSFGYYLMKGNSQKKMNLLNNINGYYYQNNFQFLGWVLPGRN
ncbi:MAG: hypothetical protein NTV72_02595 [Candidatus Taylorbacteria bacterium]|nr:hypothetical protein [Candidatus Taylorbacteria bacterium]